MVEVSFFIEETGLPGENHRVSQVTDKFGENHRVSQVTDKFGENHRVSQVTDKFYNKYVVHIECIPP